jgi:DNA-binding Lrp family transcriptional regulator
MKRNITEIEQRLILILKKDSRKSILDIAEELGVSRITAKKAFDSLIRIGKIKNFTVTLDEDERDLAIIHVRDLGNLPKDLVIEYFRLIDNTYIVVVYYENLVKLEGLSIIDVKIATVRSINENSGRVEHLHCDYCGEGMSGIPIRVELQGKTYYACCPNCERDLRKRREALAEQGTV